MGNPPFVGHQWRNKNQIADMDFVFEGFGNYGKLDYVSAWYKKAADYMMGTDIQSALVSTNSIVQGESVTTMWKPLFSNYSLEIIFAYRTFRWDSEASSKAHVHCVIIGFRLFGSSRVKRIYEGKRYEIVQNINGYLLNAPNVFIENRGSLITEGLPKMSKGSQPTDGGNLLLSVEEKEEQLQKEPLSGKWIHRFMMGDDFINNKERYCLWIVGAEPSELARALYPNSSLANLYNELTMPPELRRAHQENDRAVMQAYRYDVKTTTEASCVAELMRMYQELSEGK